ncbi:MAG TPA: hypothetical protein VGC79_19285, partial [Polyangiaceae bacterium]
MADSIWASRAVVVSALLACACGGSSSGGSGAGGANPAGGLGEGGGGSGSNIAGAASSNAGAGSSGAGAGSSSAGSANTGSECPAVTPCGGNLVGEWNIKQACISWPADLFAATCPGATVFLSPLTATGTLSLKADN